MMVSEELKIVIRAEAQNAIRELKQVQGTTQQVSTNFKDIARQLIGPLSVTAGIALLTTKLVQGVKSSIQYAASMEKVGVAFEVMLGSASEAKKIMEDIRAFSVATPFEFKNLVPAAQRLIAFGTAADDVVDVMRDLGNAAMGDQAILDRLTLAYGKLQAKGKASLEELNMFTEAGVPILKALQQQLGLTQEALFDYISTGKVGFNDVNQALQNLTRGEGQFAGMLEKQSQTLEGALSTLTGAVQDLGGALAKDFLPFLTEAVKQMTTFVNAFSGGKAMGATFESIKAGNYTDLTSADISSLIQGLKQNIEYIQSGRKTEYPPAISGFAMSGVRGFSNALELAVAALDIVQRIESSRGRGTPGTPTGGTGGGGGGTVGEYVQLFSDMDRTYIDHLRSLDQLILRDILPFGFGFGSTPAAGLGEYPYSPSFGGLDTALLARSQHEAFTNRTISQTDSMIASGSYWGADGVDSIKDLLETMGQSAKEGGMQLFADTMKSLGEAAAGAKDLNDVLTNMLGNIMSRTSEILMWGALAAFRNAKTEADVYLGLGLLALAGIAGFAGGFLGSGGLSGVSAASGSSGTSRRTGVSGTVHGRGDNIQNPVINIEKVEGSIWTTDQLQSLAVSSAGSMSIGR